ncbi:MAG: hypothetical protein QUS35_03015 [bacterium]|nr:hypothetical protein [bacterium]
MKKRALFIVTCVVIPIFAFGQYRGEAKSSVFKPSELFRRPSGILDGLIDPSRFKMTQSYSLSFFSAGSRSFNQGLYLNTMQYQLSDPLTAVLQVGYLHQPLGGAGLTGSSAGQFFISGASLEYKPSNGTRLFFDYQQTPAASISPFTRYNTR